MESISKHQLKSLVTASLWELGLNFDLVIAKMLHFGIIDRTVRHEMSKANDIVFITKPCFKLIQNFSPDLSIVFLGLHDNVVFSNVF